MRRTGWMAAAVALLAVTACADAPSGPALTEDGLAEARQYRTAPSPTVVDVAISVNESTGEFSTLIAAVVAADLVDALAARGQRTVFAPTDAAFAALGLDASTVGTLNEDLLREILLYHVASGRRDAVEVLSSDRIRMLNGDFNWISVQGGEAYIGDARIIQTDVPASNGIIHVIDAVLLPPETE